MRARVGALGVLACTLLALETGAEAAKPKTVPVRVASATYVGVDGVAGTELPWVSFPTDTPDVAGGLNAVQFWVQRGETRVSFVAGIDVGVGERVNGVYQFANKDGMATSQPRRFCGAAPNVAIPAGTEMLVVRPTLDQCSSTGVVLPAKGRVTARFTR